jgi:hypothetical protein
VWSITGFRIPDSRFGVRGNLGFRVQVRNSEFAKRVVAAPVS